MHYYKHVAFLSLLRRILTIAPANSATSWLQTALRNCSYARKDYEILPIILHISSFLYFLPGTFFSWIFIYCRLLLPAVLQACL